MISFQKCLSSLSLTIAPLASTFTTVTELIPLVTGLGFQCMTLSCLDSFTGSLWDKLHPGSFIIRFPKSPYLYLSLSAWDVWRGLPLLQGLSHHCRIKEWTTQSLYTQPRAVILIHGWSAYSTFRMSYLTYQMLEVDIFYSEPVKCWSGRCSMTNK